MSRLMGIVLGAALVVYPLVGAAWIAYQVIYLGQAINAELAMVIK